MMSIGNHWSNTSKMHPFQIRGMLLPTCQDKYTAHTQRELEKVAIISQRADMVSDCASLCLFVRHVSESFSSPASGAGSKPTRTHWLY